MEQVLHFVFQREERAAETATQRSKGFHDKSSFIGNRWKASRTAAIPKGLPPWEGDAALSDSPAS
jgi:hypothetical protein